MKSRVAKQRRQPLRKAYKRVLRMFVPLMLRIGWIAVRLFDLLDGSP